MEKGDFLKCSCARWIVVQLRVKILISLHVEALISGSGLHLPHYRKSCGLEDIDGCQLQLPPWEAEATLVQF